MRFSTLTVVALSTLALCAAQPMRADDVQTHLQKAKAAAGEKNWDAALTELDAVIALDKNNIEAHTGRVMMLVQKQDLKGAIAELDRLIELDAKNAAAYKMRATLYQQSGDKAKSHADFIAYLQLTPDETAKLEKDAQDATGKKDWENALNLWSMLSEVQPDNARAFYERGIALNQLFYVVYLNGGDKLQENIDKVKADAKASFEAAIKADPKFVPAYLALGDAAVIDQGLKVVPDSAELWVAHADLTMGKFPDDDSAKAALKDYDQALKIDPKNAAAFAGRARANYWNKQFDLSLADSASVLELKPDDVVMLRLRAEVFDLKKDYEHSAAEYDRAFALAPDDSVLAFSRYLELTNLEDKTRAMAAIGKLIEATPDSALYRVSRAQLYFDQKDYTHALADTDKALELDAKNTDATVLREKIVAAQK